MGRALCFCRETQTESTSLVTYYLEVIYRETIEPIQRRADSCVGNGLPVPRRTHSSTARADCHERTLEKGVCYRSRRIRQSRIQTGIDSKTKHPNWEALAHGRVREGTADSCITIIESPPALSLVMFTPLYGDNLNLTGSLLKLPLHNLIEKSGEWEVEKIITAEKTIPSPDNFEIGFVEFQLTLYRKPIFYVFTVLVPMVIMSVTGACGFLLPMQCGEKVSFQVSIMVSLSIFLSFVNDSMPTTSTSISRLAVYVDLLLLQSGLSLLATVTVLRGHNHREKLDQEQKEQKTSNTTGAPEPQNVAREVTSMEQKDGSWQTVSSRTRRFWSWLRNVIRRSYCCCFCCMPPEYMNVFFFVLFLSTSLAGPLVFLF